MPVIFAASARARRLALGAGAPAPSRTLRVSAIGSVGGRITACGVTASLDLLATFRFERIVNVPELHVLAKAAGGVTYHDQPGTVRSVLLHHGSADGIPAQISRGNVPGTWGVIGGTGGARNYLRLTPVRTPEEYRKLADAPPRLEADLEPSSEPAAQEVVEPEGEIALASGEDERRAFVASVAAAEGWPDSQWQFDAGLLRGAGLREESIASLDREHFERTFERALAAAARRRLGQ